MKLSNQYQKFHKLNIKIYIINFLHKNIPNLDIHLYVTHYVIFISSKSCCLLMLVISLTTGIIFCRDKHTNIYLVITIQNHLNLIRKLKKYYATFKSNSQDNKVKPKYKL